MVSLMRIWNGRFAWRAATLVNYDAILWRDDATRAAIGNSLTVAVVRCDDRRRAGGRTGDFRGNRIAIARRDGSRALPWLIGGIPAICFGLGFLILTSRTRLYGTIGIVVIACVARSLPFVIRKLDNDLRRSIPDREKMARIAGGGRGQITRDIVLPSLRPSLIAAWLLLFVCSSANSARRSWFMAGIRNDRRGDGHARRRAAQDGRRRWRWCSRCCCWSGFAAYNLIRAPLGLAPNADVGGIGTEGGVPGARPEVLAHTLGSARVLSPNGRRSQ